MIFVSGSIYILSRSSYTTTTLLYPITIVTYALVKVTVVLCINPKKLDSKIWSQTLNLVYILVQHLIDSMKPTSRISLC